MSRLKKLMRMQMEGVRQTVNGQLMKVMDCRSPVADSRPIQPVYFRHYIFYCGLALRLQNNRTKQLSIWINRCFFRFLTFEVINQLFCGTLITFFLKLNVFWMTHSLISLPEEMNYAYARWTCVCLKCGWPCMHACKVLWLCLQKSTCLCILDADQEQLLF